MRGVGLTDELAAEAMLSYEHRLLDLITSVRKAFERASRLTLTRALVDRLLGAGHSRVEVYGRGQLVEVDRPIRSMGVPVVWLIAEALSQGKVGGATPTKVSLPFPIFEEGIYTRAMPVDAMHTTLRRPTTGRLVVDVRQSHDHMEVELSREHGAFILTRFSFSPSAGIRWMAAPDAGVYIGGARLVGLVLVGPDVTPEREEQVKSGRAAAEYDEAVKRSS